MAENSRCNATKAAGDHRIHHPCIVAIQELDFKQTNRLAIGLRSP